MASRGRKKQEIEPSITSPRPLPPKEFDPVARKAWHSVCDDLATINTLNKVDRKLIEVYARDYALLQRVSKQLATEQLSLEAGNGRLFVNPLIGAYNSLSASVRRSLCDLGLTPSARKAVPTLTIGNNPYSDIGEI